MRGILVPPLQPSQAENGACCAGSPSLKNINCWRRWCSLLLSYAPSTGLPTPSRDTWHHPTCTDSVVGPARVIRPDQSDAAGLLYSHAGDTTCFDVVSCLCDLCPTHPGNSMSPNTQHWPRCQAQHQHMNTIQHQHHHPTSNMLSNPGFGECRHVQT